MIMARSVSSSVLPRRLVRHCACLPAWSERSFWVSSNLVVPSDDNGVYPRERAASWGCLLCSADRFLLDHGSWPMFDFCIGSAIQSSFAVCAWDARTPSTMTTF